VDWNQSSEAIIDEIHRQGGVAIAAHPTKSSWPRWPDAAVRKLDGSEVEQPATILRSDFRREMAEFHARAGGAAIGSSDYHGLGPLGLCKTYLLARDNSEAAIVEAVRAGTTAVRSGGEFVGDAVLVRELRKIEKLDATGEPSASIKANRFAGLSGLLLIVLWPNSRPRWPRRRP
jgi:hypothetical protein